MAVVADSTVLAAGTTDPLALRQRLLSGEATAEEQVIGKPSRPSGVGAGAWRRMSRLARLVVSATLPILERHPDLERERLGLVWGTAVGEIVPTGRFLDRLFTEGPQRVSPLAFQNSVYNAPISHLSMAFDLRGPSETIAAGGATSACAVMRGLDLLAAGVPAVIVVVADDLNPVTRKGYDLCEVAPPLGESAAALLLMSEGPGPTIAVEQGIAAGTPRFARRRLLPTESALEAVPDAVAPEDVLGLSHTFGLSVVAAAAQGGGVLVEQDHGSPMSVVVSG